MNKRKSSKKEKDSSSNSKICFAVPVYIHKKFKKCAASQGESMGYLLREWVVKYTSKFK